MRPSDAAGSLASQLGPEPCSRVGASCAEMGRSSHNNGTVGRFDRNVASGMPHLSAAKSGREVLPNSLSSGVILALTASRTFAIGGRRRQQKHEATGERATLPAIQAGRLPLIPPSAGTRLCRRRTECHRNSRLGRRGALSAGTSAAMSCCGAPMPARCLQSLPTSTPSPPAAPTRLCSTPTTSSRVSTPSSGPICATKGVASTITFNIACGPIHVRTRKPSFGSRTPAAGLPGPTASRRAPTAPCGSSTSATNAKAVSTTSPATTISPASSTAITGLRSSRRRSTRRRAFRSSCGFLLVAIDNLGRINRSYGYETADQTISAVGKRIRTLMRGKDTLGRYWRQQIRHRAQGLHAG